MIDVREYVVLSSRSYKKSGLYNSLSFNKSKSVKRIRVSQTSFVCSMDELEISLVETVHFALFSTR